VAAEVFIDADLPDICFKQIRKEIKRESSGQIVNIDDEFEILQRRPILADL
jgi:hypothetical protein